MHWQGGARCLRGQLSMGRGGEEWTEPPAWRRVQSEAVPGVGRCRPWRALGWRTQWTPTEPWACPGELPARMMETGPQIPQEKGEVGVEAPPQILPGHRTCPSWGVTAHSGHLGAWAEVMPCHGVLTSSFLSFDASLTPGGAAPPSLSQSVPRDSQQRRCFWLHTRESRVHTPSMPFIGSHTLGHHPPALITPGPGSTWLWGCLYAPEPEGTGQSYSCSPCLARIFLQKPHPPRPRPPDPPGASPCIPGSPTPRLPPPLRNCHKLSSPQQSFPDGLASQYLHFYIPTVYSLSRHWQYERKDPTHLLFAPGMHG